VRVLVTFEPEFRGDPLDAVWIADSPQNREWFNQQVGRIDPNSAVFSQTSEPLNILWDVFEHHPRWSEVIVRGAERTSELVEALQSEAIVRSHDAEGFMLARPQ